MLSAVSRPRCGAAKLALIATVAFAAPAARADFFGTGPNAFELPFVTVGDPGNVADTTGAPNPAGSVGYTYRIGKYEVPEDAIRKANAQSALDGDPLGITLGGGPNGEGRGPDKPATGLSWFEAARFVNWLNEDAGFTPAYKFDDGDNFLLWTPGDAGYNPNNRFRNRLARYVLPSVDEWYKAAFYDPTKDGIGGYWDYPTGSDDPPLPVASGTDPGTAVWNQGTSPADVQLAGGAGPWGTVGQAGNVNEWEETAQDILNDTPLERRGARGGSLILSLTSLDLSAQFRNSTFADANSLTLGFRVASVPEPTTATLTLCILTASLPFRRKLAARSMNC